MILYRSVGLQELELIYDGGMKAFPARLSQQPIFYPVLQLDYARQVASDWNVKNGQFAGYVTQFKVEEEYLSRFEEHTVGDSPYQEFWVPAEELEEFNRHITGHIKVVEAYFSDGFEGFIPQAFALNGKNAVEQFSVLANAFMYKRMDFYLEIKRNHKAVFLNYPFWQQHEFNNHGLKEKVMQAIREAWLASFPRIPLPAPPPPREETHPVRQPEPETPEYVDREEIIPVGQTDPVPQADPLPEDPLPAQPQESQAVIFPPPRPARPVKRTGSHFLGRSVRQQVHSAPQTAVDFSRGLELGLGGMYREAIEVFSRVLREDPSHVTAQTSLGVAYRRLDENDRALASYEAALRIDPIHAEAHYFRANILYSQGDVREAIAAYTIAVGLQPDLIDAHGQPLPQDRLTDYSRTPGEMHWIARPARRILDLNRALQSRPGQASLLNTRAAEYVRLGNYAQAIADYSSSVEIQPDDASVFLQRGLAYEQLERLDRAKEDFQRAIALDPQLVNEYINRGVSFGQTGNFRQAVTSFSDAIRLAPQNPDAYFNRGTAYLRQGDLQNAIEDFSTVIRISPGDEEAYYWRGISYEEAGQRHQAADDYRHFLARSKDAANRAEIEEKLKRLRVGRPERASPPAPAADNNQRKEQAQHPDVHDLILALGERAAQSTWFAGDVETYGEKAEELYAAIDQNKPVAGRDLLDLTSGIGETLKGDFQAFDAGAASPWIFIRAWEGKGFYIETNDAKSAEQLKTRFRSVEDVEGAAPPYIGFFLRV
jgi:tetratricopeptide (TPR) repeat protein